MENQKEFMLLFRMKPSSEMPTEEAIQKMHQDWGTYFGGLAQESRLVHTTRLGFEGCVRRGQEAAEQGMIAAQEEIISGILLLRAASLEEATELAAACPILHMGGSVEIRSTMPM